MIAQLLIIPLAIGLGVLADNIKVWKAVFVCHLIMLGSTIWFIQCVPDKDHIYTKESPASAMMAVSYIIMNITVGVALSVNIALLNKSISSVTLSRGAFLGTAALSSLVGVLYLDVISAQTYPHNKKSPF